MTTEQRALLARIEAFQLDDPQSAFPFTARLARDNGWTIPFAHRVVREYKRFAFLAVAAGHPVTPSDQVDQAWHLHLLYTQSYWQDFCGEVLRKPLHHHPTQGGATERTKFTDWYLQTLESYRRFFGEEAPADVWPPPGTRFGEDIHYARVNTLGNWVIRKPKGLIRAVASLRRARPAFTGMVTLGLMASLIGLATGCRTLLEGRAGPFGLSGTEFLRFYAMLWAVVLAIGLLWRQHLRQAGTPTTSPPKLDPYEVAFLSGGRGAVLNAALIALADRGAVLISGPVPWVRVAGPLAAGAHPIEQHLIRGIDATKGVALQDLRAWMQAASDAIGKRVLELGLVLGAARRRTVILLPGMLALLALALGIVRIVQGILRERPVGFLVVLCILGMAAALVALGRPSPRSRWGDAVLKRLRAQHGSLREWQGVKRAVAKSESSVIPLAIGLFGLTALHGGPHAQLEQMVRPPSPHRQDGGCGSDGGGGDGGCGGGCGGCGD